MPKGEIMRKKLSLILIIVLAMILIATLAACNWKVQQEAPPPSIDPTPPQGLEAQASKVVLNFSMPSYANSVFNAIYVDEFDISKVNYSFVYLAADNSEISSKPMGGLSENMVDLADLPLLKKAGNHYIHVTAALDGNTTVKGMFQLRLKNRSQATTPVELKFELGEGVNAFFGYSAVEDGKRYAVTEIDGGSEIASWDEFLNLFRLSKSQNALSAVNVSYDGGTKKLSKDAGFPFVIDKNCQFTLEWTADVIIVRFNLNLPENAQTTAETDPRTLFAEGGKYYNIPVQRGVGTVIKPVTDEFNAFAGLYFSGWYRTKKNDSGQVELDRLWDFSKSVGNEDIELYAKWVEHSYSYTVYPMGGGFRADIQPSKKGETTITAENCGGLGYTLLASNTKFTNNGALMRISFEGFKFGDDFDKYVAEVTVDATGKKVMLLFSEIYAELSGATSNRVFVKNDQYLKFAGLFEDYQCTKKLSHADSGHQNDDNVGGDRVGYIGWTLDESRENAIDNYLNATFTMSLKSDGSVRIDNTKDNSVNIVKIPATVKFNGEVRPITEIGPRACANIQSLHTVDMSEADNLTTIGQEAFAYDSNLVEFTQPDTSDAEHPHTNNISIVGRDAFANTAYEDRYKSLSGLDFIIINKLIYKYTGDEKAEVVDLTKAEYYTADNFDDITSLGAEEKQRLAQYFNAQLLGATRIMGGAFSTATNMTTLKLHANFEDIEAGAFSGLAKFKQLVVTKAEYTEGGPEDGSDSEEDSGEGAQGTKAATGPEYKLKFVSETAFEGCSLFMSAEGGNFNSETGAILIGNIYYAQIERNRTTINVPATYNLGEVEYPINIIAPHAFYACSEIANITFEKEENITYIGADAFQGTAFTQKANPHYVTINHILAEFYGPRTTEIILENLEKEIWEIGEDAFGSFAGNLKTIKIPNSVQKIDAYAFKGAENLQSVILSSITATENVLVGAPEIDMSAFADKNDVMREDLTLFFNAGALKLLETLSSKSDIEDAITKQWVEFYKLNKENFKEEKIDRVTLKQGALKTAYSDGETTAPSVAQAKKIFDAYYSTHADELKQAIVVYSNTGERARYEDFNLEKVSFVEFKDEKDPRYDKDAAQYTMAYDYDPNYPNVFRKGEDSVIISIYKAVQGPQNQNFATQRRYDQYTSDAGSMWITGLEGDVTAQIMPTYFTSTDKKKLDAVFHYKDVTGAQHEIKIDLDSVDGFVIEEETPPTTVNLAVNFHGLGTYVFRYNYTSRRALFTGAQQTTAITVPLNADVAEIAATTKLQLLAEDGSTTPYTISTQDFAISTGAAGLDSANLGQHKFTATFIRTDLCLNGRSVSVDVVYTVVLESNEKDFEYKLTDTPIYEDGEKIYDGTATIVGYTNRDAITVIIPETYERDGRTYKVTGIGEMTSSASNLASVFGNCRRLQTVYLSSNIEIIGTRVFEGLTMLGHIRTAILSSTQPASWQKADFEEIKGIPDTKEKVNGKDVTIKHVKLTNISASYSNIGGQYYGLALPADMTFDEENVIYRITEIADKIKLPANSEGRSVYLYFPSTVINTFEVLDSTGASIEGNSKYNVMFYEQGKGRYVVTDEISSSLRFISTNAFYGCTSLKFEDNTFTGATNLSVIGVGAFSNTGIDKVDLSNTKIKEVDNNLFENCGSLTSVKLPASVTRILVAAFRNCYMLNDLQLTADNITNIAENAFYNCKSLTEFTIGANVTRVEDNAFYECSALTITCNADKSKQTGWGSRWNSFGCPVIDKGGDTDANGNSYVVQNKVRYMIAKGAENATVVKQPYDIIKADIPDEISDGGKQYKVTAIAKEAFAGCVNLQYVKLGQYVTSIGDSAFAGCAALSEFVFAGDNALDTIGDGAFDGCTSLMQRPIIPSEVVKGDYKYSIDRINMTATVTGFAPDAKTDTVTIGDELEYAFNKYKIVAIADNAFQGAAAIKSVTLGKNVETIGAGAFTNCSGLMTVTATAALKTIKDRAFAGCTALNKFDGATGLEEVAEDAFDRCDKLDPKPQGKA